MKERQTSNILLVSLVSAAAGAGVALLLAPRSGKETRERLKASAADMKRQAQKAMDSARHTAREGVRRGKHLTESIAEGVRSTAKEMKAEGEEARDDLRSSLTKSWKEER